MGLISWMTKKSNKPVKNTPGFPALVKDILKKRPPWVRNAINPKEAALLHFEMRERKITSAIEVGVASGFSSSIILNAMLRNSPSAQLFSFDLSERCYYDESRMTGDALPEILGSKKGFNLRTGIDSSGIQREWVLDLVDLIFIDANHKTPWAALDVLATARFLRPGGLLAFHDVNFIFAKAGLRRQNGPRDIYRTWHGDKFKYKEASNLGFLVYEGDQTQLIKTITACLYNEWDTDIPEKSISLFKNIAEEYYVEEAVKDELNRVMDLRCRSATQFAHREFDYQFT